MNDIDQAFRLSTQQRRVWSLARDGELGIVQAAFPLRGGLDRRRLRAALEQLVERHEILRTRFHFPPGLRMPYQGVDDEARVSWRESVLESGGGIEEIVRAETRRIAAAATADRGACLNAHLVRREPELHTLLLGLTAAGADARTLSNLQDELRLAYEGPRGDSDEPVQYADVTEWQWQLLEDEDAAGGKAFWEEREGAPAPATLACERTAEVESPPDRRFAVTVEPELVLALDAMAGRRGAATSPRGAATSPGGLETAILSAWGTLLARLADGRRADLGVAFEGRPHDELAGALGPFVRFLPYRLEFPRDGSFADLLAASHRALARMDEHQTYFDWESPGAGTVPVFGFEWIERPPARSGGGVSFEGLRYFLPLSGFKLRLVALRGKEDLALEIGFDRRAFADRDVERVADGLLALLGAAAENPERAVGELPILGETERREMLFEHQGEPAQGPAGAPVHRRFEEQARLDGSRTAVVCESEQATYAELNGAANRLARHLQDLGVAPDVPVALCLERSLDSIVALLAALKAGGAFAFLDVDQPRARLGAMLEDLAAPVTVTRDAVAGRLPEHPAALVRLDRDHAEISARSDRDLEDRTWAARLAYVVFTSGSTGRPKGVAVEHRQLSSYVDAIARRLDPPSGSSFATVSTLAADLGHTAIFPALTGGGCLHVVSRDRATDPRALADYVRRHAVDALKIVPSHLQALLAGEEPRGLLPRKRLVLGGEALGRDLAAKLRRLAPDLEILNHYGPSETTVGVLTHRLAQPPETDEPRPGGERPGTVPIGRPLRGRRAYLLDRRLEPVPTWLPGQLAIAGDGVTRGYLGLPGRTAGSFVPDPWSAAPGERMYLTGDLVRRLGSGEIEFLGRADHQVKFHGFRVELDEIRKALKSCPGVRDGVAVLARDEDGRHLLVAYYVSRQPIDPAELRDSLSETLPEEVLPSLFAHLRRLPLNLNGKVAFDALPSLEEIRSRDRDAWIPPSTPSEEILAGIWCALLGQKRVGAGDNFFHLGGHSLLATQLLSRLRQIFRRDVPLRLIFERPVLRDLAASLDRRRPAGDDAPGDDTAAEDAAPGLVPVPRRGDLPLSFAQERMWFLHQLQPESPAYNGARAYRLAGRLDVASLAASFAAMVERHETLRTTFAAAKGRPRQMISDARHAAGAPALTVVDLSRPSAPARDAEIERLLAREPRRPFDLGRGPLQRACLVRRSATDHLLMVSAHHIIADAWSRGVFLRELMACYKAFARGRAPRLEALPIQYADFACWQRRHLEGEAWERELDYWKRRLAGAPETLELPADFPRPPVQSFRGAALHREIPAPTRAALSELARDQDCTLFMILLAAFQVLICRCSGEEDVVVGTDIANRHHAELEGLIGFFVNNVVLRTDLSGNPAFAEVLRRVRETTLGAYAHQDLPFDRLVKALRVRRDASRTPLFQILFVMQNVPLPAFDLPDLELRPVDVEHKMCKFDLAVFLTEVEDGLKLTWNYSTDLFRRETIARFHDGFVNLLVSVLEDPGRPLSRLEMFTESQKEKRSVEKARRETTDLRRLKRRRSGAAGARDLAAGDLVTAGTLEGLDRPRVLRPRMRDLDLSGWAAGHRELLARELLEHGALLLRGFQLGSLSDFERFAAAVCDDLYGDYGDLPPEEDGTRVYRSTPYPADKTILFHNESSHLPRWPMKQFFFCVQPSESGGETPIVDGRAMLAALPNEIVHTFERKQLLYVRNFVEGLDVSWRDFFKTGDRSAVEERCRREGVEWEWRGDDLRTRQRRRAVARHPVTGERVWFNQLQLHHPACLDAGTRASMGSVFREDALPRNLTFGDGTPISDAVVERISETYRREAASFPWQQGDVLMVDNMLTAHARNPFHGERKIVVAMGDMMDAEDLPDRPA